MRVATFLFRRRRELVLFAVTAMLHLLALGWLGRQFAPAPPSASPTQRITMVELLPAAPPVLAPLPRPAPIAQPSRRRIRPVARPVPAPALAEVDMSGIGTTEPATQDGSAEPGGTGASPTDVAVAAPASAPEVAAAPAAPEPAPAPPARRFKTSVPPSADIALDVRRTDADGTQWKGDAAISWKQDGQHYRMTVAAGISVLFARVNLVELTSEGEVGEGGFAPVSMTESRRGRAATVTHFNRKDGQITFSASQKKLPLLPGTQDKASVPLQLAAIARGDPDQIKGEIEMLVGEENDASLFRFIVIGQEEIETRLGRLSAWHLTRPPKPGSYNSRLDIWLAPSHGWLPVQIRNTETSGAVTTQTINKIAFTNTGS